MAKKCYAVRKGNKVGIFNSWDECKSAVAGFSGAEYRGFNTNEEAEAYLHGIETAVDMKTGTRLNIEKPTEDNEVNIYTDGSYKNGDIALGVYIEAKDKTFSFYGVVNCRRYSSINNIAGELLAVLVGVQLAKDIGYTKFNILYDQNGVECWYTGAWKANGDLQRLYVTLLNSLRLQYGVTYNFLNVQGHSGVNGNVMADKLANRALNFKRYVDLDTILRGILTVKDVPLFI
jgi:ribonuclease HI